MASLTRKPTSANYFACFRDKNGKQHRVSTGETRKSVAQKIADKFELAAKRKTSRRQLWDTLNELQAIVSGEDTPNATLAEFCKLWLANRQAEGIAPATLSIYKQLVERFLAFLGPVRAGGSLIDIHKRDIEKFRNCLVGKKLSAGSVNRSVKILRMLFKTARVDGYIFEDPAEAVRTIKDDSSRRRRPLTEKEIRQILAIADPEWQSLVKLGLFSGQRLGDFGVASLGKRRSGRWTLIPENSQDRAGDQTANHRGSSRTFDFVTLQRQS